MIIYMLMNLIEERCYVGQTINTLSERFTAHWDAAIAGSQTNLSAAIRKWDDRLFWHAVVLQRVTNESALDPMETFWIDECSSRDPAVGYNMKPGFPERIRSGPMTESRREFFRECGRLGAAVSAGTAEAKGKRVSPIAGMTPEQKRAYFSECGKRGKGKKRPRLELD